jgi:hypothetical protein
MSRALACLITLCLAAPVAAAELTDGYGFSASLSAGGARACVVLPERLQRPADCPGVDLADLTSKMKAQMKSLAADQETIGVAVLSHDEHNALAMVVSGPADVPTAEGIDQFIAGFQSSMPGSHTRRDDAGHTTSRLTVAGTPAVRFVGEGMRGLENSVQLAYLIYGDARMYNIFFMTGRTDEADIQAIADQMLASIKLAPLPKAKAQHLGESDAYRRGYRVGFIAGRTLLIVLLAAGAAWLISALRRRRRTPPPTV